MILMNIDYQWRSEGRVRSDTHKKSLVWCVSNLVIKLIEFDKCIIVFFIENYRALCLPTTDSPYHWRGRKLGLNSPLLSVWQQQMFALWYGLGVCYISHQIMSTFFSSAFLSIYKWISTNAWGICAVRAYSLFTRYRRHNQKKIIVVWKLY